MKNAIRENVVITGASNGLGRTLALALGKQKRYNFILSGRNQIEAEAVTKELMQNDAETSVQWIIGDLVHEKVLQRLLSLSVSVSVFVNNAGVGVAGEYADRAWEDHEASFRLNCLVAARLLHHYAREMKQRGNGILINISSLNAFFSTPYFASYSASKAFLFSLGEALAMELAPQGVKVINVCPGGMKTHFHITAGLSDSLVQKYKSLLLDTEAVADSIVRAMGSNQSLIIPGIANRFFVWVSRWVPRDFLVRQAGSLYKEFSGHGKSM